MELLHLLGFSRKRLADRIMDKIDEEGKYEGLFSNYEGDKEVQ
jgi:hypothetical protein